jgi:polyhydroxyalkanoate synthase subunit PhaC
MSISQIKKDAVMSSEDSKQSMEQIIHARCSKFSGWMSPSVLVMSYYDWLVHLINSPGKLTSLVTDEVEQGFQLPLSLFKQKDSNDTQPVDKRFKNELWNKTPFNFYAKLFLFNESFWNSLTTGVKCASRHHENIVNFTGRQILDIYSPSNSPFLNPEIINKTIQTGGKNFVDGFNNYLEDMKRYTNKQPPVGTENFIVGKDVGITPGNVVFRNDLIELIQYNPTTEKVYRDPILIVPACIMKFYILDLSPNNSMVKYLVDQGHTVFMISWKNPTSEDRNLSVSDYVNLGVIEAMNTVSTITGVDKVHTAGYCIGGTLLMLAAALLAKQKYSKLKSITLFAAQIDFKDAGELLLFIDDDQLNYLDDIMCEKGYLDGSQMAGAFSMLQSVDLIWSRLIHDYMLGERRDMNDLMAWDLDTTRLPYKMHSEYLRKLFLNNDFVEGRYAINNQTLLTLDIKNPMFVVATSRDHVAPWESVYKVHSFTESDIYFILTSGGHNSGVVNEPGHPGRSYQARAHKNGEASISATEWVEVAENQDGSWWPEWQKWLAKQSGDKVLPPEVGNKKLNYNVICAAPGTYVLEK